MCYSQVEFFQNSGKLVFTFPVRISTMRRMAGWGFGAVLTVSLNHQEKTRDGNDTLS